MPPANYFKIVSYTAAMRLPVLKRDFPRATAQRPTTLISRDIGKKIERTP